jgi:hypothetical protein
MQKFCFFLFEETGTKASSEHIIKTYQIVLDSERIVFESILQGLTTRQIIILAALAKEPTASKNSPAFFHKPTQF